MGRDRTTIRKMQPPDDPQQRILPLHLFEIGVTKNEMLQLSCPSCGIVKRWANGAAYLSELVQEARLHYDSQHFGRGRS